MPNRVGMPLMSSTRKGCKGGSGARVNWFALAPHPSNPMHNEQFSLFYRLGEIKTTATRKNNELLVWELGKSQKGAYAGRFQPNGGGVGKPRRRDVPARAPTCFRFNSASDSIPSQIQFCLRFNYEAFARRPQPMQSKHNLFFIEHAFGADSTVAQESAQGPSLLTTAMPPQFYYI